MNVRYNLAILAVAVIWAAVILASAKALESTPYFAPLLPVLGGGAGGSIIVLGGACRHRSA
ncbi:MAG: hypothetical protein ACE5LG_02005 [Anaerolineae bacterium]